MNLNILSGYDVKYEAAILDKYKSLNSLYWIDMFVPKQSLDDHLLNKWTFILK